MTFSEDPTGQFYQFVRPQSTCTNPTHRRGFKQIGTVKIHAPNFACDTDAGNNSPTVTDQEILRRPVTALLPGLESSDYQEPPPHSDRLAP